MFKSFAVEQMFLWMQMEACVFVRETDSIEDTREMIRMMTKVAAGSSSTSIA